MARSKWNTIDTWDVQQAGSLMLLFDKKLNNFGYCNCRYKPISWKYALYDSVHFMYFGTSKSNSGTYSVFTLRKSPLCYLHLLFIFYLKMLSEALIITCSAVYKSEMFFHSSISILRHRIWLAVEVQIFFFPNNNVCGTCFPFFCLGNLYMRCSTRWKAYALSW
jgi:hypothetical protein